MARRLLADDPSCNLSIAWANRGVVRHIAAASLSLSGGNWS
jgi:hypothetical protein